jgi:hypothetical protein
MTIELMGQHEDWIQDNCEYLFCAILQKKGLAVSRSNPAGYKAYLQRRQSESK